MGVTKVLSTLVKGIWLRISVRYHVLIACVQVGNYLFILLMAGTLTVYH
jgi:hypothetical protein